MDKRNRQTRLESMFEVAINIASGFIVSYCLWIFIVPIIWPEHASSMGTAFGITALFTVTSVLRSYAWRRFFEREIHRLLMRAFRLQNGKNNAG
jgi:hypothetical protein